MVKGTQVQLEVPGSRASTCMLTGASLHVYVYTVRAVENVQVKYFGDFKKLFLRDVPRYGYFACCAQTILSKMLKVQVPRYGT